MPIRAVIFDFGGVLLRTIDDSDRRKWEQRLGLPDGGLAHVVFESDVATRAMLGQLPEAAVWADAASTLKLSPPELDELQHDFWTGDRFDAALADFLRGLRPRYRTAVLSNAWLGARELFTGRYGLDTVVDLIVISAEEGLAKPDRRFYQLVLDRLGVRAEEAVFVDDMPANVAGARAAGIQGILFQGTEQTIAEVRKRLDCEATAAGSK